MSTIQQTQPQQNLSIKSDKNAWIYAILLWFFGYLGIHKFYLNKTGWGIAYLLTAGIFGFGILVDYISMIFVNIRDNERRELEGANSLRIFALVLFLLTIISIGITIALIVGLLGTGFFYSLMEELQF